MNEQQGIPGPRDAVMGLLSAAEHIVSESPAEIDDISIKFGGIHIFFYHRPEDTAAFAAAFELPLVLTAHGDGPRPYLEALGPVNGVEVRAWSLGDAEEQERYAACLPVAPAALPEAWRAAGAA